MDPALARDLSLAREAQMGSITLPGTQRARTQVVSAVELGERSAESPRRAAPRPRRAEPRRSVRRATAVAQAPAPAPAVESDVAPAEAAEAPAVAVVTTTSTADDGETAAGPVIENPRPEVVPVDNPSPRGGGDGGRGGWGGWGGVVIRGGGVDGDHCERDRGGRRGGGMISINVRGPMGTSTFPRY